MSVHEWIQNGAISDEIAEKRGLKELIRCKDCKYWHKTIYDTPKWLPCMSVQTYGNWFCADGVKRDE